MTDRAELIERITSGSGGDRELDIEVGTYLEKVTGKNLLGGGSIGDWDWRPEDTCPHYTTSIDAIAAIPGANIVSVASNYSGDAWQAKQRSKDREEYVGVALDEPRARLAAVLYDPSVGSE